MEKTLKEQLYDKFEDQATNYFQDEPSTKAGVQLQIDAWNDAVDQIKSYINQKNIVQVETLDIFKYNRLPTPSEPNKVAEGGYQPTNTVDTSNPPRTKPLEPVAIQSDKERQKAEEILIKWGYDAFVGQTSGRQSDLITAMQEYASLKSQQERERAIQECIDKLKEFEDNDLGFFYSCGQLYKELEKLKSS